MRATRAIIHLDNYRHNMRVIKDHIGADIKICAAIKADAYGHGALPIARISREEGAGYLGVATVEEGIALRKAGIHMPVLLLSLPVPEEITVIIEHKITPICADILLCQRFQNLAAKKNTTTGMHLKIDTGMGRIGCPPEQAPEIAEFIFAQKNIHLEGICTHFPVSDTENEDFTRLQTNRFKEAISVIKKKGINPGLLHAANSGALINKDFTYMDMVRPGIMLYGYYPSHDQKRILPLRPVMEFVTKVVFIKKVPAGTGISYGLTHTTTRETHIATLPVGYGDGYSRLLSNRADVLIRGKRYPVAGRVCMDQIMVDLGPRTDVKLYDDVTLFGPDPAGPDAEEIADIMNTIPYEVTCLVTKRVERLYTETE